MSRVVKAIFCYPHLSPTIDEFGISRNDINVRLILQSKLFPEKSYIGITRDLKERIKKTIMPENLYILRNTNREK